MGNLWRLSRNWKLGEVESESTPQEIGESSVTFTRCGVESEAVSLVVETLALT